MTPYDANGYEEWPVKVFPVSTTGGLCTFWCSHSISSPAGVRPVINLRSDVTITGKGTVSNPYQVVGA